MSGTESAARPLESKLRRHRLRLPRHSVRLRLTLLYGGLFLTSGAGLLALTYLLVVSRFRAFALYRGAVPSSGTLPGQSLLEQIANQQHREALTGLLQGSGLALAAMTVISIGLGWLVAGRVLRPLRTITTAAQCISASNLHERLEMNGPDDELKELGETFDALLGRLEATFEAQRQFVANASHELRTPLARQRTIVEVALADPEPSIDSLQAACNRVLAASEQQERLIEALLTLARSQRGLDRWERIDLAVIVNEVMLSRQPEAQRRGISARTVLQPAPALGDLRLAERLVANLLDNALRYNVQGGWLQVTTHARRGCAMLSVANTGPVVPPDQLGRLFRPFQRLGTDRTRSGDGLGLGLSIVNAIVEAHGGQMRARSLAGGGLEIQVRFPRASQGLPEGMTVSGSGQVDQPQGGAGPPAGPASATARPHLLSGEAIRLS
jgi:signal transduction histidine kinase